MKNLILIGLISTLGACASDWRDFQEGQRQGGQFWNGMVQGMAQIDRHDRATEGQRTQEFQLAPRQHCAYTLQGVYECH